MLFLSATLSNAPEFASWVACVHGNPCHVVYTDYRPTPLVHYGFPAGGKGLYLVGFIGRYHYSVLIEITLAHFFKTSL